jgi:phospholipase/carboxylesterase
VLVLPGYGDTSAVITRRLHLIDPDRRWTVVVAEPVDTGPAGPMWYAVDEDGPDPAGVERTVASVALALDEVARLAGVARTDVVLAGYSQGGAAALATLLDPTSGPPPAAVGVLAGYLAHRDDDRLDLARAAGRPVLFAHGRDDDMVDPLRGRGAAKALHRGGARVTWAEVAGSHRLGPGLLAPLAAWLADLAAGRAPHDPPPGVAPPV